MKPAIASVVIVLALLAIIVRFVVSTDSGSGQYIFDTSQGSISGMVDSLPEEKDNNTVFIVALNDGSRVKIYTDIFHHYDYGDFLNIAGNISTPRNFRSDSGREFDYINFLLKDGICCEMKNPIISVVSTGGGSEIKSILFKFRNSFVKNIQEVMGEPHASLAGGLVVGAKSSLGKDLLDQFRSVGLIHIIVLSGYNITIVADSIRRLLKFLPRSLGLLLGAVSIILFGVLVGGGATVVRSCVMALIGTVSIALRRSYRAPRALFIAGYVMVFENPSILLHDPSFQLSFLATLGLIVFAEKIESNISFITEKYAIRGLIATTFATQLAVAPFILYMMGTISVIGFLVNIFVLPLVPMTMLFVTLTGLTGFLSSYVSIFCGWISYVLLEYELGIVDFASRIPLASIEVGKFPVFIVVGIYAIYIAYMLYIHRRHKKVVGVV